MAEDERLRAELADLAGKYTPSAQLRVRTEARVRQVRRRRHAGAIGAVVLVVAGVALLVPAIGSDDDERTLNPGPGPGLEACAGDELVVADFDGDGQPDQVFGQWVDDHDEPTDPGVGVYELTVCTGSGIAASIAGVSNGEAITAIDVEGDGRAELLAGGTTGSAVYFDVVVLIDGELEVVTGGATEPMLREGIIETAGDPVVPTETAAYGCEDLDLDGQVELVQVDASFDATGVSWTKTGYRLDGAHAIAGTPQRGTEPFTGDRIGYPRVLTTPCRDVSEDGASGQGGGDYLVAPADWPAAGVAVRTNDAVVFYDDDGSELGTSRDASLIAGIEAVSGVSGLVEITFDGSAFVAAPPDPVEAIPSCSAATGGGGARVALCGRDVGFPDQVVRSDPGGRLTVLSQEPPDSGSGGHWRWAVPSPDGKWVLAQWSGECEVPVAYLIPTSGGAPRAASVTNTVEGPVESIAVGWTADGRAIVTFPDPACGSGLDEPGTYLLDPDTGNTSLRFAAGPVPSAAFRWRRVREGLNAPERAISRALTELGVEGCCGEPSEGSPNAAHGAVWNGTSIPIFGTPIDPSGTGDPPYVAFNDLVTESHQADLDGLPVVVGEADLGAFLAFTCGDQVWSLGGAGDGERAEPDDLRALAAALIDHLYCTMGQPPLATGHG